MITVQDRTQTSSHITPHASEEVDGRADGTLMVICSHVLFCSHKLLPKLNDVKIQPLLEL